MITCWITSILFYSIWSVYAKKNVFNFLEFFLIDFLYKFRCDMDRICFDSETLDKLRAIVRDFTFLFDWSSVPSFPNLKVSIASPNLAPLRAKISSSSLNPPPINSLVSFKFSSPKTSFLSLSYQTSGHKILI